MCGVGIWWIVRGIEEDEVIEMRLVVVRGGFRVSVSFVFFCLFFL